MNKLRAIFSLCSVGFFLAVFAAPGWAITLPIGQNQLGSVINTQLPVNVGQGDTLFRINYVMVKLNPVDQVQLTLSVDMPGRKPSVSARLSLQSQLGFSKADQQLHLIRPKLTHIEQLSGPKDALLPYQSSIDQMMNKELPGALFIDLKQLGLPGNLISDVTVGEGQLLLAL